METSVPNLLTLRTGWWSPTVPSRKKFTWEAKILNVNTIIKMGFVDRIHVQCTIIFHERDVQEEEEKKTYATNISI